MASEKEDQQQLIDDLVKSLALHFEIEKWKQEKAESEEPPQMTEEEAEQRWIQMLKQPVDDVNLTIKGNDNTEEKFIREHFHFPEGRVSTHETMYSLEASKQKLTQYDFIDATDIQIDRNNYNPYVLDVGVDITEKKKKVSLGFGGDLDHREFRGQTGLIWRNAFGRGESLELKSAAGGSNKDKLDMNSLFWTTTEFSLNFNKPRFFSGDRTLNVSVLKRMENHTINSSYIEDIQGVRAHVRDDSGRNVYGYNCDFRMINPVSDEQGEQASAKVLAEGRQPSLKSSIYYRYTNDSRKNLPIPSSGSLKSVTCEVAGLGGNVEFFSLMSQFAYHVPLFFGTLNFGFFGGFVSPLRNIFSTMNENYLNVFTDRQTRINDRLSIPGRLLTRGYQWGRIGEKDGKDYLNGDSIFAVGASYSFPLGRTGLAGHLFASAANVKMRGVASLNNHVTDLLQTSRTSMGASIVLPIAIGRLEFGLAVPIIEDNHKDEFSHLFWGFDINFL